MLYLFFILTNIITLTTTKNRNSRPLELFPRQLAILKERPFLLIYSSCLYYTIIYNVRDNTRLLRRKVSFGSVNWGNELLRSKKAKKELRPLYICWPLFYCMSVLVYNKYQLQITYDSISHHIRIQQVQKYWDDQLQCSCK